MKTRSFKLYFTAMLVALLVPVVFAVTCSAAISVEKGVVVGLDASKSYEYAPVNLADYMMPQYTSAASGATEIKGLAAGIYFFREKDATDVTAVYVPGTAAQINDLGTFVYEESWGRDKIKAQNINAFIPGVWTGTGTATNVAFAKYYLSEIGGSHIKSSVCVDIAAGKITRTKVRQMMEAVVFKYAYAPEEFIPVEDLYTMSFNVGVRLGSLDYQCDTLPQTKYVLYTMNSRGEVTQHIALFETSHAITGTKRTCSTTHTIVIEDAFPDAEGWIIGLDVYPYGQVPMAAKFGAFIDESYQHKYYNTMYFIEFRPAGYATRTSTDTSVVLAQYNGANKAYIEGYANGTFAPNANITKAEAATILARLLLHGETLPTNLTSRFVDVTVNDWFFDAVAYIEDVYGFDYLEGSLLNPNKAITRGELAQMIFNAAGLDAVTKKAFRDVTTEDSCYEAVATLSANGIIEGYGDKTFRPEATVTRAEAVTMFNRFVNLVADEKTVSRDSLTTVFSDIDGHWAEYQILMAANDNVKSLHHAKANVSGVVLTDTLISFETNQVKINVERANGKVHSIINKYDNTDISATSSSPWFFYHTTDNGITFFPSDIDIVNGRVRVKFPNKVEMYFIVETHDNFMSFELDNKLPKGVATLYFGKTAISCPFSEDPDSYRISSVAMTAFTDHIQFPGGKAKVTNARVMAKTGHTMGGKMAITFSKYGDRKKGEHRAYLKEIVDAIDPTVGTTSTHGGPYTLDNQDLFGDYLISSSISPATAQSVAETLNRYSIDQLDLHQGGYSFIQGDFNFVSAKASGETFTTAAQFKERIGNTLIENGIQLGLHTYSSLISSSATTILTDPKWQQDLLYKEEEVLTLKNDVTASSNEFLTNEDASGIQLFGYAAGGGTSTLPWSGPNTAYFLIDEEIIMVSVADATGLHTITRERFGTKAAPHKAGSEIRHLLGHYSMFQSKPGSDLFYHIADLTAQAYNDGGFEMIYLDGLESFSRESMIDTSIAWYYYDSFIHRVVSGCNTPPIIEGSSIPYGFWAARGRAGAVDNATRGFKKYNMTHASSSYSNYYNYYYTATLGWFNYAPDVSQKYKNTWYKTMFRDDLDHMGSLGIAFDLSTVYNHSTSNFDTQKTLRDNSMYFNLYSRLRKANYFSEGVKKQLRDGYLSGKEYKLEEQTDGTWAFREMTYLKHKVFDLADNTFATKTFTNPYGEQTPYIRVEQKYSTLGQNEVTLYDFDETADVKSGTYTFNQINLTTKQSFKINVTGNGKEGSAMLIRLHTAAKSEVGYLDMFIPTDFTGTREFILMDTDNADYDGYSFSGINLSSINYSIYRSSIYFTGVTGIQIFLTGDCEGVKIDDLRACTPVNAPAVNPTVTIGGKTIVFKTTLRSGEYIEYLPELNKAYHHSYNENTDGTNGNTPTVTEISIMGSTKVPTGEFNVTYNATGTTEAPLRAYVTIGVMSDEIIANEADWSVPTVELPENIQYVTLT